MAAEIAGGVMAYNYRPELHKTVEFNLLWAVERFYGTDVANTTILNRIQEGVSPIDSVFEWNEMTN